MDGWREAEKEPERETREKAKGRGRRGEADEGIRGRRDGETSRQMLPAKRQVQARNSQHSFLPNATFCRAPPRSAPGLPACTLSAKTPAPHEKGRCIAADLGARVLSVGIILSRGKAGSKVAAAEGHGGRRGVAVPGELRRARGGWREGAIEHVREIEHAESTLQSGQARAREGGSKGEGGGEQRVAPAHRRATEPPPARIHGGQGVGRHTVAHRGGHAAAVAECCSKPQPHPAPRPLALAPGACAGAAGRQRAGVGRAEQDVRAVAGDGQQVREQDVRCR